MFVPVDEMQRPRYPPPTMRTSIAAATFAVIAATACSTHHGFTLGHAPKQEWIAIAIGMRDNMCKVVEQKPAEIRTEAGSQVHWIVTGGCTGPTSVAIKGFKKGGNAVQTGEIFDVNGSSLEDKLPSSADDAMVRLHGKVKTGLQKAHYTYQVWLNGTPAEFKSPADDGDMYLCPIWPCGDFSFKN